VSTLYIVLVFIALELLALLGLFAGLMTMHVRRSGKRIRRLRRRWARMFPEALEGRRHPVVRIGETLTSDANFKAFHVFLDEQLRQLGDGSTLQLRHLCRALGVTRRLQRQLAESSDALERAAAAKTLGRLRERMSRNAVAELLHSEDSAAVLAAGYASASFRDPRMVLPVFRAVYKGTRITLHGTAELLSRFGQGVCPVIHELLEGLVARYSEREPVRPFDPDEEIDRGDQAAQVVMVDLLAFFAYRPAAPTLLRLLRLSEHEEVVIHLVKALAKLGDAAAIPSLSGLLTHSNWVIRSQTVQALAALEAIDTIPLIHVLLEDEDLRVRVYARNALESLKEVELPAAREDPAWEEAYA
jgi:HEAT repeat protein